ncbi:MAG: UDP-N-acetylmuramoylalanine--D-glutamate ligase [Alphaproteobacteria bacterium]|jgi:UDP-N-acetylmuramoylalanine--D-glutamate ligase
MTFLAPPYTYTNQSIAIIGYGVTGKACVNFLLNKGAKVSVFDAYFDAESEQHDTARQNLSLCELNDNVDLSKFDQVVVSPGVNLKQAFIQNYIRQKGDKKSVVGDIELFARELNARNMAATQSSAQKQTAVIAVTGSNGKSTVVDMLTKALIKQDLNVVLGGNFGTSALSLIAEEKDANNSRYKNKETKRHIDLIVLELSSFQLESTYSLRPNIACILNVTSDHLDRHGNMAAYTQAKQQIYINAHNIVFNRDDSATYPEQQRNAISVGLSKDSASSIDSFYQTNQGIYRANHLVLDASRFPAVSQFQLLNMQVVLACAQILNMDMPLIVASLREYKGLPHRFETVYVDATTVWINDSKATNPGACIAAVESLSQQVDYIVLIAGGDAKGADIQELSPAISKYVDRLILIGKDAHLFTHFDTPFTYAASIEEAVEIASAFASSYVINYANKNASKNTNKNADSSINDSLHSISDETSMPHIGVMLSPACASIDMFANYQERGQLFCQAVNARVAA